MTNFDGLGLIEPLLRAIALENYTQPTPIQARAIPYLLEGRDVLGCARTGTGKTAAFALPVLQRLAERKHGQRRTIRALVLSPTRELAAQIGACFSSYGRFVPVRNHVIFGGVGQAPQVSALRAGIDILVATPGRLLDLHGQGLLDLGKVEFFILDEADRMLDMGFIHDIRRVLAVLPKRRQNLLFSATMPPSIAALAGAFLANPVRVEVDPEATTVEEIQQLVMFLERNDKRRLLVELLRPADTGRVLIFTRTKHGANRLAEHLHRAGLKAAAIHGNKSQNARNRAMDGFRDGECPILIATDLASRGLDVDGISHVFNYELPFEPEIYVHRIGRTGRAGRGGVAISFCDESEGPLLRAIERLTGVPIRQIVDHAYHCQAAIPPENRGPGRRINEPRQPSEWQPARPSDGRGPSKATPARHHEHPRPRRPGQPFRGRSGPR